jgi:acyl-coenzyme A thioesterase PaaI-like protein
MSKEQPGSYSEPDPENPGWFWWRPADNTRFNGVVMGKIIGRAEDATRCRVRMFPQHHHTNFGNMIHGAVIMALADVSLFVTMRSLSGLIGRGSVTQSLDTQFIGGGKPSLPLDSVVEILRETSRTAFLRGLIEQEGNLVASFSATVRKPRAS